MRKDTSNERSTHVSPPFRRVLVANRGEIAVRIIRACHELGCEAAAVFSDADADAVHVRRADRTMHIGPTAPSESYLRADALVDAALRMECDALHPGYGFLSEQPGLARACESAGIAFVGPTAATLALLGDKLAARRIAREAGVAAVPGTLEAVPVERPDQLADVVAIAESVGFPLLVKAAAGGGGRGMREVAESRDLPAALASAAHEAAAAFGDGTVYLERVIRPARHVEVQLLGDATTVVALGERDCSVQRRHQKLVEEAPAPGLSSAQRRDLHAAAVALGRAAGLRSAATAEFLLDEAGRFWFLEVNARLQVEHGVTELVSGVDLVHEQLRIAAGGAISGQARAVAEAASEPRGHAIEVRLTAEDPGDGFRPSPGRISRWSEPAGPGVRVDSGVEAGSLVPAAYDSLIAKVLVWAPDRDLAIARLRRALDELEVVGVQTALPFFRALLDDAAFRAGALDIGWVERTWDPGPSRARALDATAVAAALLAWSESGPGPRGGSADGGRAGREAGEPDGRTGDEWRAAARREAVDRWPRLERLPGLEPEPGLERRP